MKTERIKKLTLIAISITVIGLLIPVLNVVFFDVALLIHIANVLIYSGLFFTYLFLVIWQSQRSKTGFYLVLVLFGLLMIYVLVFSHFRFEESERTLENSFRQLEEAQRQLHDAYRELEENKMTIDSLANKLESATNNQ